MDKSCCLMSDATGQAAKEKGGGRERVIYFSFFIQSPLKELFTNPKEDKRIVKIEITCHCHFRLSEEFPNIPQFQLVETFFDEHLGNFDGCVHMLDSVFKGVGCSFILYRTINKNVYPNGSCDYRHYCNEIDRLKADVAGVGGGSGSAGGGGPPAAESLQRALMAQSGYGVRCGSGGGSESVVRSDSMFSSFSVTNSTVSKMFRELENDLPVAWGSGEGSAAGVGGNSSACAGGRGADGGSVSGSGGALKTSSRPESTSQESLDSLEEFSCLESAVVRLEDIVNENYEFVIEDMFFEAVTTEMSAEFWENILRPIAAHQVEVEIRGHVASWLETHSLVSQSVCQLARSLVNPAALITQACTDCFNDNLTIVCTSPTESPTALRHFGCGSADTYCDFDYDDDGDETAGDGDRNGEGDDDVEDDAEDDVDNQSTVYEGDSTMDISESLLDRRWSGTGMSGACSSAQWNNSRLQPTETPSQQQRTNWLQSAGGAVDDLFNSWCTTLAEEACLETLVGLVAQRLVVVLYKSSCSKSQFECRVVRALACFNRSLNQLAERPPNQRNLTSVVDGFFTYVVETVMDPDAHRMGHMSGVVAALQSPTPQADSVKQSPPGEGGNCVGDGEGGGGAGWQLLQVTRGAFVSAVHDRLASLGAKLQRKSCVDVEGGSGGCSSGIAGGSGSPRLWQLAGAQQAAAEVFAVASNYSSSECLDELESLPSESATVVAVSKAKVERPEKAETPERACGKEAKKAKGTTVKYFRGTMGWRQQHHHHQQQSLLDQQQQQQQQLRRFRRRLERINEAMQQPLAATDVDWEEPPPMETALPLPVGGRLRRLRQLPALELSETDGLAEADAFADADADTNSDSVATGVADRCPLTSPSVCTCASTVSSSPAASGVLGIWKPPLSLRCEEASELGGSEECLELGFAIIGHASMVAAGRHSAGLTVALVTEAGAQLHSCATATAGACPAPVVATVSLLPSDPALTNFALAQVPAEAPPTLSESLSFPQPALRLAVSRTTLYRLDAAEQLARPLKCPATLLADRPVCSSLSSSSTLLAGHRGAAAWTVHAGVRPSSSHCCPLVLLLPDGPVPSGRLAVCHGLVVPARALSLAPAGVCRFATATLADARDAARTACRVQCSVAARNGESLAGSRHPDRIPATPLRLCGVPGHSDIHRTAKSSRRVPGTERALVSASDRPAPDGGDLWPVRPVREWHLAEAVGSLRPTLSALSMSVGAGVARPAELFDAGGCVGRIPATPVDAAQLAAADAGPGALLMAAVDCGVAECLATVDSAPVSAALVPVGRVAAVEPPPVRGCCKDDRPDADTGSGHSNASLATLIIRGADADPHEADLLSSFSQRSVPRGCLLMATVPPARMGAPVLSPGSCSAPVPARHAIGRSQSASSLASSPSIDDLLSSLARQQTLLDRLYVEKVHLRRRLNRPFLADP